ncbi:MAG: hypothetical protein E7370_05580 [Clostridiales bacterium]|nr:hypothetical protein [Clostridiales bacterium]
MYKNLRIICSVISAVIVAAAIFVFIYAGWLWGIVSVIAALAFFGLTVLFKNLQEQEENKTNPSAHGDFITGKVKKDDE